MKQRFFELCRKLSYSSNHWQHKIGAVVVRKNRVISTGFNQVKTHPKSPHPYFMLHAELAAIIGCSYEELKGATIYVFRQHRNGECAMAKPCPTCEAALRQAGIKKVYYSADNEFKEMML